MNTKKDRQTDLTKRPLSFTEAAFLADNLETIEYHRALQQRSRAQAQNNPNVQPSFVGKLVLAVIWLALLYGLGSVVLAVLFAVFM